jgi:Zinc carboxypeptidase
MCRKLKLTQLLIWTAAAAALAAAGATASQVPAGLLAPLSNGEVLDLPAIDDRVPRPDQFLGYPIGSRFTHWERISAYFDALAATSPRVKVWEYGRTYEGRPLKLAAIGSPENLARLDDIRRQRQRLAEPQGLAGGERSHLAERLPAVVWLAYGVHGDEASSSEAAMVAAWALAAGQGEAADMLAGTIVLIDPLCNPDGRERYVHGFEQREGAVPNPRRDAAEHFQPWPGGRPNHYLIDLNRDWAWATQQETRSRIAAYRAWEPQVYVDFHEMATDASYFFPPPAEPVHPLIDRRVLAWLDVFGRANAAAFDLQGWVYYKQEEYDLFYPGYGDSYPSLHGAVGMTYEMAGGGRGGLAVHPQDGTELTLADRIARHLTTSLATVRTASRNARKLMQDFVATRLRAEEGPGQVYLWLADQPEARSLADLLTLHGVRVGELAQSTELAVQPVFGPHAAGQRRFPAGTFAVSTAQPLGALVQALLAREAPMSDTFLARQRQRFEQNRDTEFYDVTAWALPLAYNVQVWSAGGDALPPTRPPGDTTAASIAGSGELGWLVPPQGLASYRLAALLQQRHIHHRLALYPLADGGEEYPAGTLYIPRGGNPADTADRLGGLLAASGAGARAIASSFQVSGLSLGSNSMPSVRPARVGVLSGPGVDSTSFGFVWFLLDREVGLPCDRLDVDHLRPAALADLDVLVLPDGAYEEHLGERARGTLDAWIKAGGELVAIGGQTERWLHDHDMVSFKPWKAPAADEESEGSHDKALGERDINTPGAVLATRLAALHPLAAGVPSPPPMLVKGAAVVLASGDPRRDVLVVSPQEPVLAGFAWPEARQRLAGSLLVGVEQRGSGSVVLFLQEPAFRMFWRGTMPLLLNAVMYGPSISFGGRN